MNYDLKRPCKNCPFRSDIPGYLTEERVYDIVDSLRVGMTFSCHKTVDYDRYEEDDEQYIPGSTDQHCAGALIFLEHNDEVAVGQMTRIAMRFGGFNPDELDMDAPVFDCEHTMAQHHDRRGA